jgi:hypothetical protein
MGLFDFFGKKQEPQQEPEKKEEPVTDPNLVLLHILQEKLQALGLEVKRSEQYQAITVLPDLEIASAIISKPDYHPMLMHAVIFTIHPVYFQKGIEEHVVGLGSTPFEKAVSVADNFMSTTLKPIMDGFSDSHVPALDFYDQAGILWHPKPGTVALQGNQAIQTNNDMFINLLRERLRTSLPNQQFNWLKIYAARQADGSITVDCNLNNEVWETGRHLISVFVGMWPKGPDFMGMKQFIVFRRCDSAAHQQS